MLEQIELFAISLVANLLSSLAGGGAGLLQLPALIFLGLPFPVALATHKLASVALGIGASIRHLRAGNIDWRFAGLVLGAGLPGVVCGALWVLKLPELVAQISLGLLTIALGIYSIVNPILGQASSPRSRTTLGYCIGGFVLFAIGMLNGSLTSGSGLFVTIWLIRWFGLSYRQALAYTMILVGFFWNGTGAITLIIYQSPHWLWLPALLAGSLLGGYLGAHLAIAKGNLFIKRVFEGMTIMTGLSLLTKALIY
jgi:uncharacterized membrane protein YfcA